MDIDGWIESIPGQVADDAPGATDNLNYGAGL